MGNADIVIKAFNTACKEFSLDIHIDETGAPGMYFFIDNNKTVDMGLFDNMNNHMREYTNKISETKPSFRDAVRNNLFKFM